MPASLASGRACAESAQAKENRRPTARTSAHAGDKVSNEKSGICDGTGYCSLAIAVFLSSYIPRDHARREDVVNRNTKFTEEMKSFSRMDSCVHRHACADMRTP